MVRQHWRPVGGRSDVSPVDAWSGYALAFLVTAMASLARWLLNPVLEGDSPFSIFLPAILITAWRGGLGPGLASLGLGAVAATYFFLMPQGSFAITDVKNLVHFLVFLIIGSSVCLLGHRMRSALARASSSEGEARRTVGELAREITVREQVEERLRVALQAAEAATQAKGAFMAYMSHEIRTPLNGALGMLELLGRTTLDGRQTTYANRARESAELLLSLLNDVLDFTKIELGRFELEEVRYRLGSVLGSVEGMFATSAEQKGLEFRVRAGPALGDLVGLGDPSRVRQVLVNLVGNAVKFTDHGEVTVTASLAEDGGGRLVRFEVRDTGIGIDPETRDRLFQPFSQADSSMSRRFGGSGLGLAICQDLVTMMGGTIDFASRPGAGSTFWFVVPFREAPTIDAQTAVRSQPDPARTPADGSRRVLVVEDNAINADVAVTLLRDAGYPCDHATTGPEALAMLAHGSYDLVLMDCQLPGLDGFATTRRFRDREMPGRRMPILALTASATPEVRERAVEAGMDGCLSKPIAANDLLEAVAATLAGSRLVAEPTTIKPEVSTAAVVDLDSALSRLDGRDDLLARLIEQFLAGTGAVLDRIQGAARDRDAHELGLASHRLKGQAGTFGAATVVEAAGRLESLANQADWGPIQVELARLEAALPELENALADFLAAHTPSL